MRSVVRNWAEPCYSDLIAGIDYVTEREYIDKRNLFVAGGRYGGYTTGWIVGQTTRFAAAAAQRGVSDLGTFYGTSSIETTSNLDTTGRSHRSRNATGGIRQSRTSAVPIH
jgi:dipeptidyl aminopeptidase/acylaminoacyl peptidase